MSHLKKNPEIPLRSSSTGSLSNLPFFLLVCENMSKKQHLTTKHSSWENRIALKGAVTEETDDNSDVKNKNVFMVSVVIRELQ